MHRILPCVVKKACIVGFEACPLVRGVTDLLIPLSGLDRDDYLWLPTFALLHLPIFPCTPLSGRLTLSHCCNGQAQDILETI